MLEIIEGQLLAGNLPVRGWRSHQPELRLVSSPQEQRGGGLLLFMTRIGCVLRRYTRCT